MSSNPSPGGGANTFIEQHPSFAIGGVIVLILLVVVYVMKNKAPSTAATGAGASDLTGLATDANGNHVVYVPTSTSFSTDNSITATSAPGAPATINTSTNTTATTSTSTVTTNPLLPVRPILGGGTPTGGTHPVKLPPVPAPSMKGIHWTGGHHVGSGETLTSIAEQATGMCRAQGAPGNFRVTAQQIYNANKSRIDALAKSKGATPPYSQHIYAGELLVVPEYR